MMVSKIFFQRIHLRFLIVLLLGGHNAFPDWQLWKVDAVAWQRDTSEKIL